MATIDPESRIAALIGAGEELITAEFLAALVLVRDSINLADLAALLETGRVDEAFRVVGRAAARLAGSWGSVYTSAGVSTADFLTSEVGEIVIAYDRANPGAVRAVQENQARLVREFTQQQRNATTQALVRGITEGANPIEQARAFRNSIGLTAKQEEWVANYRRNLEDLDRRALDRVLRDARFDPTVRRAIEQGKPLPKARIDKLVERYRERMIIFRSKTIARTESLRAVHAGTREMYEQAITSGQLDPAQLIRIWNTAGDEQVRDFSTGAQTSHRTMHGQQRMFGEPFTSGAFNQAFDPGTFGVAEEDIQCRCVVSTRILTPQEAGLVSVNVVGATL